MRALFGPAGNSQAFADAGYKGNNQAPEFVSRCGLDAYEYQCGRGVRVNPDAASVFAENAKKFGVKISLHTPYYISLSSIEAEKRDKSIQYILDSANAVTMLGGDRIVVHSGSCSKISREEALALATDTLKRAQSTLDENGLSNVRICPETMGKLNQLGTLEEVLELCSVDERIIPTIDFGHLNARDHGVLKNASDFELIIDKIADKLGEYRAKHFHSHFSKIEYSSGGEKKHLTFSDSVFGPDFEPLAEVIYKRSLEPVIICESDNTMSEDALYMKKYYNSL